jgi:hypothetical protein
VGDGTVWKWDVLLMFRGKIFSILVLAGYISEGRRINPLTPELNPSAQLWLPRFLLEILIFKRLTARRLYKSFGVKRLKIDHLTP